MTNDKIRVRDLSAELGISNKDLIQALRELGVQAKSHMSNIGLEEAEQVRDKFKASTQSTEVVTKEIQPGMIVRRRRKTVRKVRTEEVEETPVESPESQDAPQAETKSEQPETDAPRRTEEVSHDSPETGGEEEAASEPEDEAPAIKETPARILAKPGEEKPEPVAEQEDVPQEIPAGSDVQEEAVEDTPDDVAETPQEETVGDADKVAEEDTPAEATSKDDAPEVGSEKPEDTPAADEEDDSETKDVERRAKKKKGKKVKAAGPQVRIISMPDPSEVKKEAPAPRQRRAPARPGRPAGRPGPDRQPGAQDGKRMVEFSPKQFADPSSPPSGPGRGKRGKGPVKDRGPKGRKRRRFDGDNDGGFMQERMPDSMEPVTQPLKAAKRKLKVEDTIRLSDMAHQMGVKAQALIKVLLGLGVMATINQALDMETSTILAAEFGYEIEKVGFSEDDYIVAKEPDSPEQLKPRPPVVTIMGHVDHGKTSLLDAIRESNVTSGEAGGITQHIGAYHVASKRGELVFLDTPGHEAFTAMRARGAQVTDIVILVVAADDGVMEQTREAINHAKAAEVPIIVAVNKIDKEGAEPERVQRELSDFGLLAESWGGDTIFAEVSAKKRIGIDELLELILLQAEILELKANPDKPARGHIVEAKLDKGRGPVATVLVQEGTLNQGDSFVCGVYSGRVRAMFNDQGRKVKSAGPAIPVEVQGIEGVPEAGDEFVGMEDEKVARRIADQRQLKQRERDLASKSKVTLETFLSMKPKAEEAQQLNLIIKADVQGSLEAVVDALLKLSTDEVKVNVIHGGAGAITESDILLASASEAIIIGFNIRPTAKVKDVADEEHVEIRFYDIIYKLVNEVKDAMSGMLAPEIREVYLGQAEVRDTFSVPKVGIIAGCGVVDGKISRDAGIRLLRDGVVIYTGNVSSLKRFKDDAKEVLKGYECGIGLEKYNDIKVGDVIEAFEMVEEARTL